MRSWAAAAEAAALDGRTKNKNTNQSHEERNRIGLLRASGSFASRWHSSRANGSSRAAAARCRVPFRRWCQLGARAVGEATCRCRAFGIVRSCRRRARTSWLSRTAARQRREPRLSGSVDDAGLLNAGTSIRSSLPVTRVAGLVSKRRAEVTSRDRGRRWWRHRAAWRLIRNVVASSPNRVGSGLMPTFGSPGGFAENGRRVSRITVWRSPPLASPRAAWRVVRTSEISRVVPRALAHSTGRPTRKWSRRARPSCAILSPRRAAHLQR